MLGVVANGIRRRGGAWPRSRSDAVRGGDMQYSARSSSRGRPALIALIALLSVLIPAGTAFATAPRAVITTSAPPPAPGLPINISLLGLNVKLDLPLTLNLGALLGARSTPAPPPTSTPPGTATPSSRPPRSTVPPPATRSTPVRPPAGSGAPAAVVPAAAVRSSNSPKHPTSHPAGSTTSRPKPPADNVIDALVVSSNTDAILLIVLVVATALAVAFVVRLSGRRGGHRV